MMKYFDIILVASIGALVVALVGLLFAKLMAKRPINPGVLSELGNERRLRLPRVMSSAELLFAGVCAAACLTMLFRVDSLERKHDASGNLPLAAAVDWTEGLNAAIARKDALVSEGSEGVSVTAHDDAACSTDLSVLWVKRADAPPTCLAERAVDGSK